MSQELIYTSSPKGLKLGARGFCTVASTPGMAKNLADRLESLSGYRHLYPPGSAEAHLNPVNFSYLRFSLGGQTFYLLSRIADAGLDYTQRTNKLAHHIVLQQSELPSAGPAWLASQLDLFETTWNREPELLPGGRRMTPQGQLNADVCSAWKSATGDAGWAGVLADSVIRRTAGEAYLIYKPGADVLELFLEAQALLSPEQRWEATFSTYFTNLPPGIECRWRGVVDGTQEALRARRSPEKLVIDLVNIPSIVPSGDLVNLARGGLDARKTHDGGALGEYYTRSSVAPPANVRLPVGSDSEKRESGASISASISQPPALPKEHKFGLNITKSGSGLSRRERAAWMIISLLLLVALAGLTYYVTRPAFEIPGKTVAHRNKTHTEKASDDVTQRVELRRGADSNEDSTAQNVSKRAPNNPPEKVEHPTQTPRAPQETPPNTPNNPGVTSPNKLINGEVSKSIQGSSVPEPKKPQTWDDVLAPNGFHNEVALPVVSRSTLNDEWRQRPIVLTSFRRQQPTPLITLTLLNPTDVPLKLDRRSDLPAKWEVRIDSSEADISKPLATIDFDEKAKHLQFQWADEAQNASSDVKDAVRNSVLQLTIREIPQTRAISFSPAIRSAGPIKLNADRLIASDKWAVPISDDLWIPPNQKCCATLRIVRAGAENSKPFTLEPGHSKQINFGMRELGLIANFTVGNGRPLLLLKLVVDDDQVLFPDWYRERVSERRQLLEEAIIKYVAPPDRAVFRKTLPRRLSDLTAMESSYLSELNKNRSQPGQELEPRYRQLQIDFEKYGDLGKLSAKVKSSLSKSQLQLRITRRIVDNNDQTNSVTAEFDIFVAE
ncbi:MAG: hypothetical protein WD468_09120 [Pirellulales bacterium]